MPAGREPRQFPFQGIRDTGSSREGDFGKGLPIEDAPNRVILHRLVSVIGDDHRQRSVGFGGKSEIGDGHIG